MLIIMTFCHLGIRPSGSPPSQKVLLLYKGVGSILGSSNIRVCEFRLEFLSYIKKNKKNNDLLVIPTHNHVGQRPYWPTLVGGVVTKPPERPHVHTHHFCEWALFWPLGKHIFVLTRPSGAWAPLLPFSSPKSLRISSTTILRLPRVWTSAHHGFWLPGWATHATAASGTLSALFIIFNHQYHL